MIFERVSVPGSLDCPDHNQLSGNCWSWQKVLSGEIKDTHKLLKQKMGVLLSLSFYLLCTQKSVIFERVSVPESLDCPDHN